MVTNRKNVSEKYQLNVYEGDYGLVSLDVECIQSILYARIAKVPTDIRTLNNIPNCIFYSAPSLHDDKLVFKTYNNIVSHLRTLHYTLDYGLSAKQCSETFAITNLVQSKLGPVISFLYWVDQRNCDEFTNLWFMKSLPLPFNYIYTKQCKNKANDLIETLYPTDTDLEVIKSFITILATQCLSTLSTRLGTAEFYYGNAPTSLDVVVYGHIAPLVKLPFPSNEIPNLLSMWPNLTNFVKRIDAKFFPEVDNNEVKYLKPEKAKHNNEDDVSYTAIVILAVSATSLVIGFAISKGIISTRALRIF